MGVWFPLSKAYNYTIVRSFVQLVDLQNEPRSEKIPWCFDASEDDPPRPVC